VQRWISSPATPLPARTDFARLSDARWEWRSSDDRSVIVDVDATGPETWAVRGVGGCTSRPALA
jgi:hypothetical protein